MDTNNYTYRFNMLSAIEKRYRKTQESLEEKKVVVNL